jgi:hypothetical protein
LQLTRLVYTIDIAIGFLTNAHINLAHVTGCGSASLTHDVDAIFQAAKDSLRQFIVSFFVLLFGLGSLILEVGFLGTAQYGLVD